MYDEMKVTRDNIVELSQFKVGDTVTLLKKINCDEGIYREGHVFEVAKVSIHDSVSLPNKSFEKFKNNYMVNENIYQLYLHDPGTNNYVSCSANVVAKGKLTETQLKNAINRNSALFFARCSKSITFALLGFFLLIEVGINQSIPLLSINSRRLIYFLFFIIFIIFIKKSFTALEPKNWTRIKKSK